MMPDREKVIRLIEEEISICESVNQCYRTIDLPALRDILAILKAQEAVVPRYNARTNWYECGACHYSMTSGMHCRGELIPAYKVGFCAKCGQAVKWE